jgi:hypothetical protein
MGPIPMFPHPPPIWSWTVPNPNGLHPNMELYTKDIKDKKIITFDTVKYYPSDYNKLN